MPASGRSYVIAGAGIAGMTMALALAKFGATVVVLERNHTIQEFGAGLQISPNARRILDRLGLGEALDRVSLEPNALDIYPQGHQHPLISMELGAIMRERFGARYAVMHRADLADVLCKACRRFANIDILFGVRSWDVVTHARGVTVAIDEADGQSRTVRANGFIGADGVHSQTRLSVLEGPAAQFRGRIAWRCLVPVDSMAGQIALDRVSVFFGSGFHLVCYPLPHRKQVNLALFMPGGMPKDGEQPRPARPGQRVSTILGAAGDGWTPWPMYTVDAPDWHQGNIGIIGDAAHAMVPFQAQGAAMGIEDAATLAPLLAGTETAETAMSRYAELRKPRIRRVAALSAENGRIFHMAWPLSMARDAVMRLQGPRAHLRRLDWVYAHDVGDGPGA
ncbi:FAD-dependent monooxygenase [uncultured Devosia sp.]|uniref:FAD-dependent monooxygenase n=1 Tax=uncultured Devosia sp. TaxID=211434 RepID=UPI002610CA81|nr:FAD-dependent monooxygenase [uncultured Devosia sp.]